VNEGEITFGVESIVEMMTKAPLVRVEFGETVVMVPVEKAREMAFMLIEGAESASQDFVLAMFLVDTLGVGMDDVADVIRILREQRHGQGDKS